MGLPLLDEMQRLAADCTATYRAVLQLVVEEYAAHPPDATLPVEHASRGVFTAGVWAGRGDEHVKFLRVASEHGWALLRTDLILFACEQDHGTRLYFEGQQLWIQMPFEDYLRYWEKQGIVKEFLDANFACILLYSPRDRRKNMMFAGLIFLAGISFAVPGVEPPSGTRCYFSPSMRTYHAKICDILGNREAYQHCSVVYLPTTL